MLLHRPKINDRPTGQDEDVRPMDKKFPVKRLSVCRELCESIIMSYCGV
jgi:hypothetical protein